MARTPFSFQLLIVSLNSYINTMSTINDLARQLSQMKATEVVRNEMVRDRFIAVFNAIHRSGGEAAYEREANYFNKQLRDSENLSKCTATSVFLAFIDIAVQNVSVEPGTRAMAYLLPRNCKVSGPNGSTAWEKRCYLTLSGYAEIALRQRAGQILYADNPVVVYEGDSFEYGERDGRKYVNFGAKMPRNSTQIVACFMKITRTDGSIDYAVMLPNDWQRLADYSAENNKRIDRATGEEHKQANSLYHSYNGGIDPGFLIAKCIKHAFKSYPKLQIGKGTALESDITDEQQPEIDPYGGVEQQEDVQPGTFQPKPDTSGGVVVTPPEPTAENPDNGDVF